MRKRPVISLPKRAAPTTARGARSEAERAERGVPDAGKRSAQKEGNQRNTGVANTESAAARDRKTEADRRRPYTLILVGTSPRESTAKSLRHSAAPAGMPS